MAITKLIFSKNISFMLKHRILKTGSQTIDLYQPK